MNQVDLLWDLIRPLIEGLPDEEQKKIRERFHRVETQFSRLEQNYHQAIQNRHAVHALLTRTSDDLLQRYQTLFDHSGTAMMVIEEDGMISLVNSLCENLLEYRREEIEHIRFFTDILTEKGRNAAMEYYRKRKAHEPKTSELFQTKAVTGKGKVLDIALSIGIFPDSTQGIVSIIDITEKIRTRKELKLSEKRFRDQYEFLQQLLNTIPSPVFYRDPQGIYQGCNEALSAFTGKSREEMIGKSVYEVWPKEMADTLFYKDMILISNPGVQTYETVLQHRDGTAHTVVVNKATYFHPDGSVMGIIGVITDITKRKTAEERLRKSEERYRLLLQNVSDGVIVYAVSEEKKGKILEVNDRICQILDYPREQLLTMTSPELLESEELTKQENYFEEIIAKNHLIIEGEMMRRDGSRVPVEVSARLFDLQGEMMVLAVIRDTTERRMIEQEREYYLAELKRNAHALQQTNEKLSLLSRITVHDMNNQLTTIIGILALQRDEFADPHLQEYIAIQNRATRNLQEQIQFVKEYQYIGSQSPRWHDVAGLVSSAAATLPFSPVTLTVECGPYEVYADPLIVKVFYTLLENAIRHGEGVTQVRFSCQIRDRELIILCEDDGRGVPAEHKENIFQQKYFKHTGFGLFLATLILQITGITIRETGEPGKGARFEISVPDGAFRERIPL